jgi:hypothetical protein
MVPLPTQYFIIVYCAITNIMFCGMLPLQALCCVSSCTIISIMLCDNMWCLYQHYVVRYVVQLSEIYCVICGNVNSIMLCDMWYNYQQYIAGTLVPLTTLCCVIICGATLALCCVILSALCCLVCGTITSVVSCGDIFHEQMTVLMVYIKVKFSLVLFDSQFNSTKTP